MLGFNDNDLVAPNGSFESIDIVIYSSMLDPATNH
jgi:hypothetical protein